MSRRRLPTEEEIALFHETLKQTVPVRKKALEVKVKAGAAKAKPARMALVKKLAAQGEPTGLDGGTKRRLEQGELDPQARIDLHGMTEAAAHRALITFIRGAAGRGLRLVLVVTGKGLPVDPYEPFDLELNTRRRGVLKTMTPRWLCEPELARLVADIRTAHRRHGGEGALYVYLRKPG